MYNRTLERIDVYSIFDEIFGAGIKLADRTQDDKNYYLTVDIPGVKKSDVNIVTEGQTGLIVESTRDGAKQLKKMFILPEDANLEATAAKLEDGVLSVTVPKRINLGARRTIAIC